LKSGVDALPLHNSHTRTPIFINVKTINLDIGSDQFRQRSERWIKAQCGRDQINQWRFVANLTITEQLCGRDMATSSVCFDASPVVDALKDVLAIFVDFNSITTSRPS